MGRGSLPSGVPPLRKLCWTDTTVSCGLWSKSLNTSKIKQMRSLVLEMELILMYYGAGACDRVQCSIQQLKWSNMEMIPVRHTLKWQVCSSLEPMLHLHGVLSQQGSYLLESKRSHQKALCPTVSVVSEVTERQEWKVGIAVSFFLLGQFQDLPHMLSCPVSL